VEVDRHVHKSVIWRGFCVHRGVCSEYSGVISTSEDLLLGFKTSAKWFMAPFWLHTKSKSGKSVAEKISNYIFSKDEYRTLVTEVSHTTNKLYMGFQGGSESES
jgi:hypothetical protein